jgi:cell division protein FtsQ
MNPWHNSRLLNAMANLLFAAALLLVLAQIALRMSQRAVFTLTEVQIESAPGFELRHVSSAMLRQLARRGVSGNFFSVNLGAIRASFETVPWVRRATVRRIWPNRLLVGIEEHKPLAIWDESRLVNLFGELFSANVVQAEEDGPLPSFAGPEGSEALVVRRYEDLRRWLSELRRTPESLTLSARYAWSVTLDDGTTLLLGRDQGVPIEERVKRWAGVFPRVQARLDRKAELIDLRYPNGFAIRSVAVVAAEATDPSDDPSATKPNR